MATPEPLSPSVRHARHVVAAVFLGFLVLLILFATWVLTKDRGPEILLFTMFIWPLGIMFGLGHALISPGRMPLRVLVVLVGLTTPILTAQLADFLTRAENARRSRDASPEVRAQMFLCEYMEKPRRVIFVDFPYVVVEDGYSLFLDGVEVRPENMDAVRHYLETEVLGRSVRAELSTDSLQPYHAGVRSPVTSPYAQGPSKDFGDAPATIAVDDVIVNFEINTRWGYDGEP